MRRLLSRPSPNYNLLIRKLFSGVRFKSDMAFFKKGREALIYGIELLDIKPTSIILVPAYMCDPTIAPLRERGYKIVFFDIEEDLSFNFDVLEGLMKRLNVQAILAPHYFGLPANIKGLVSLCKRYDVAVIEDCAHSFLTKIDDQPVGSFGDIAIFSMRKTLAVPDGGALKVNLRTLKLNESTIHRGLSFQDITYLIQRFLEFIVVRLARINIYSDTFISLRNHLSNLFKSNSDNRDPVNSDFPSNPSATLIAYLSNKKYLEEIALKRSLNFEFLTGRLLKLYTNLAFKKLPRGCVPQFYVLRDDSGTLVKKLKTNFMAINNWPGEELPLAVKDSPERYPIANKLSRTLLMLPIHQSTTQDQLDQIVKVLVNSNDFLSKYLGGDSA
jgi:perosamine synthetase